MTKRWSWKALGNKAPYNHELNSTSSKIQTLYLMIRSAYHSAMQTLHNLNEMSNPIYWKKYEKKKKKKKVFQYVILLSC